MSIELTTQQSQAIAAEGEQIIVIDPKTKQAYRLLREEIFEKLQNSLEESPWTQGETGVLAGEAFGRLDDTDYSDYLDKP